MNIFILETNVVKNAQSHCDKHVVKMILESAQILCSSLNIAAGKQITTYKTTHANHPSVKWTGESLENFKYLYSLMLELDKERLYRFNSNFVHKSVNMVLFHKLDKVAENILPKTNQTPFPLVMPDEYKISSDPVECYREYYRKGKTDLLNYTKREKPEWLED